MSASGVRETDGARPASEWFETLPRLRARTWEMLAEADHPFRTACLATAGLGGGAEARMVVLRGADAAAARLEIHTDRASRKAAEIEADPRATLLFWAPGDALQVRARCRIAPVTGPAAAATWKVVPDPARRNYGGQPPPSTQMARAEDYAETVEPDRFALLSAEVSALDVLHLGRTHRRALFDAARPEGTWLAP